MRHHEALGKMVGQPAPQVKAGIEPLAPEPEPGQAGQHPEEGDRMDEEARQHESSQLLPRLDAFSVSPTFFSHAVSLSAFGCLMRGSFCQQPSSCLCTAPWAAPPRS